MGRLNDHFRDRIRMLRDARRLRQKDLGEALGVSGAQVSNLERGDSVANLDQVEAAASFFGVPVGDLLGEVQVAPIAPAASGATAAARDADEASLLEMWRMGGGKAVLAWVVPHIKNKDV